MRDERLHADPEFYSNLPFNKFKNPPSEVTAGLSWWGEADWFDVFQCVEDDNLDYADCDYLDIYTNGPLKYREASQQNAELRKKKLEERKAVKSSYL